MIVTNKDELDAARRAGAREITIVGDLALQVHRAKNIITLGKFSLMGLAAAIAAIPFTGGLSVAGVAGIAAVSGVEIALITAVIFVGLGLLLAIWQGYDEIEFSQSPLHLKLKKKS